MTQTRGPALHGEQVTVLGGGRSGAAAARLAAAAGARVRLLERDPSALTPGMQDELRSAGVEIIIAPHRPEHLAGAGLVVPSPGIPNQNIRPLLAGEEKPRIVSELEMASWFVDQPILAVTGTNGKTTTVSLMGRIFASRGWDVFLGGNIGTPLSAYILEGRRADLLVLEVSSFQLQNTALFRPTVSVFLNFSQNHLDHHRDLQEYWQAKIRIFQNQDRGDTAILPVEWRDRRIDGLKDRVHRLFIEDREGFDCPRLLGPHNQRNMEAASLACACFGIGREEARPAIEDYRGQPHRLQVIREVAGIRFVNDSKATTMEALEAAVKSFQAPILLLAGGRHKGGRPERLAGLIADKVKTVGLFGESRELFAGAWKESAPLFWEPTLERAFHRILARAAAGDVVLLSPGTSSFDLFANYEQRGRVFGELVQAIPADRSQQQT